MIDFQKDTPFFSTSFITAFFLYVMFCTFKFDVHPSHFHHDSMGLKSRLPRALQRGCQLGTCQLHNLASTLYHFSKGTGKEESKKAKDPQGYGR